jgi:ubiquinol-cytochrome c reductase cytochrome c1 subunit
MTRSMLGTLRALVTGVALVAACGAMAAEGARMEPAPASRLDVESLQRGAAHFVNYCQGCHSAQFMRYNRLTALGLTDQQIRDNLMFATDKIGSPMLSAMTKVQGTAWFGAPPPDLSVEARVRGKDWLYSYLLAFYRDDKSTTGWNNLVFPSVAMPHVLWQLQGTQKLVENEYEDREKAEAAVIAIKGIALDELRPGGKFVVKTLADDVPGSLSSVEYRRFVGDLVNFLDYMAEPARNERINIGIIVLIYLGLLFVFAYALKRAYWNDVH